MDESKKLVYLTGDDTAKLMSESDAEEFQNSLYERAVQSAKDEGTLSASEDSDDYESDAAFKAGQDADGECKIFDYDDIMDKLSEASDFDNFKEELDESFSNDSDVELMDYSEISEILEEAEPESSKIY